MNSLMASCLLSFLFILFISSSPSLVSSAFSSSTKSLNSQSTSLCKTTPYPNSCLDSLKLTISINVDPNIFNFFLQNLKSAISEADKLTHLLTSAGNSIVEKQRGSVQDCKELHQITLSSLQKTESKVKTGDSRSLSDARTYLSAALTNKNTCEEGLSSASGPMKSLLINSMSSTYNHVSNSLSILSKLGPKTGNKKNRRLLAFPEWVSGKDRRLLQSYSGDYRPSQVITVAGYGTGNFSTISDAVDFAPIDSDDRVIIYVTQGVYEENVVIPSNKRNILLLGDGSDVTFIIGNRSVVDGWTTFRSATLAVSGEGFLARDIRIENTAGPSKHQAVALRVNADLVALYHCTIIGFQDTLYTHSFRQFYRECDIYGTIDYICGNAAVVLQGCNIISRMPMPGQFTVVTAQSRQTVDEDTGISIQNCSIWATDELYANSSNVRSYLGRPWREYSRTVYLESYIDDFIEPIGWSMWNGSESLDTLYYGEYENYGPGSSTDNRVTWPGYHVMDYDDAYNYIVSNFIIGDAWLDSTSIPYDDGV